MHKIKNLIKLRLAAVMWWQVNRLIRRNRNLRIVGVVGSYGKTGTKFAISNVLSTSKKVRFQSGNYNDIISVPLVFFDSDMPNIMNPFAWLTLIFNNEFKIRQNYPYDVVVLELGTDGPGQIAEFGKYIKLDVAVVTSIAREHMEFFDDIDAVAKEELAVAQFTDLLIVNSDLCDKKYFDNLDVLRYGFDKSADYHIQTISSNRESFIFSISEGRDSWLKAESHSSSKLQVYSATAAAVVAHSLGCSDSSIVSGIANIVPVGGRMQHLEGIKHSLIIDESYNSSPEAVRAALDSLYSIPSANKIALLGNMNELGRFSPEAHEEVGRYCDPKQLSLVVTLGPDANKYLAKAAIERGCRVMMCDSPYRAGEILANNLLENSVVLVKGSQNRVFAEEAIKFILDDPADQAKLVRQSKYWLNKKQRAFGTLPSFAKSENEE